MSQTTMRPGGATTTPKTEHNLVQQGGSRILLTQGGNLLAKK